MLKNYYALDIVIQLYASNFKCIEYSIQRFLCYKKISYITDQNIQYSLLIKISKIPKKAKQISNDQLIACFLILLLLCILCMHPCIPISLAPILVLIFTNDRLIHSYDIQAELNKSIINLHNILLHIYQQLVNNINLLFPLTS